MSEQTGTSPEPESPSELQNGGEGESLSHLSERVDRLAGMLEQFLNGAPRPGEQAEPPDIKAEVRAAVREVQAKDKAKAEREAEAQSLQDQIADLKAKVETPPFEYRPVTNRMGWAKP